jgi:hypothetical protein
LAWDANGDGDYADAPDWVNSSYETDGDIYGQPDTGAQNAGSWFYIIVAIIVPWVAAGTVDSTSVYGISSYDYSADICYDNTTVNQVAGVWVQNTTAGLSGIPGETLTYNFVINSIGSVNDNFTLTAYSESGWLVEVVGNDWTGAIAPGASITVDVEVTIPANTPAGTTDYLWLNATSTYDPTVWDNKSITTPTEVL